MTAAIFALAGVILGALIGGAVQVFLQRRTEKRDLRVACRLLEYELIVAGGAIDAARSDETFDRDLRGQLSETAELSKVWSEYRQVLSAELDLAEWGIVSVAILTVWLYINTAPSPSDDDDDATAQPVDHPFGDPNLDDAVDRIKAALKVLEAHSG